MRSGAARREVRGLRIRESAIHRGINVVPVEASAVAIAVGCAATPSLLKATRHVRILVKVGTTSIGSSLGLQARPTHRKRAAAGVRAVARAVGDLRIAARRKAIANRPTAWTC